MCETRARCCFCLTLRTGSLVSAAYSLLMGTVAVAWCTFMVTDGLLFSTRVMEDFLEEENARKKENGEPTRAETTINKKVSTAITWEKVTYFIALVCYVIWMISAMLVVVGVAMKRRNLLVLWICMTWFLLALMVLGIINHLIKIERIDAYAITCICIFAVTFIGNALCVNAVTSYFNTDCRELAEITESTAVMERVEYKKCSPDVEK